MQVRIKYHADITKLEKIKQGDLIDLRCAEDVEMKQGEYKLISLGVSMELPVDYEAHVYARSSTPSKHGIICANSVGIIDSSYNGTNDIWRFPAYAIRDTFIPKDTRIAQFRIVKNQPSFDFIEVDKLNDKDRGGIGSTGVN